jgi:hypothetical protein
MSKLVGRLRTAVTPVARSPAPTSSCLRKESHGRLVRRHRDNKAHFGVELRATLHLGGTIDLADLWLKGDLTEHLSFFGGSVAQTLDRPPHKLKMRWGWG